MVLISNIYINFDELKKYDIITTLNIHGMKKFSTLIIALLVISLAYSQDSEEKKIKFTPVGFINLNAIFDFKGLDNYDDFTTSEIPLNPTPYEESIRFHMTARQTRLGAKIAYESPWGQINGFVSGDFYTGNTGDISYFRLRQAYINFGHFTFGQHNTTFGNPDVCPTTVDFEGPNSSTTLRNPMVLYENNFKKNNKWSYSLAIEMRGTDFTNFDSVSQPFNAMPNFVANINKEFNWGVATLSGMADIVRYFTPEEVEKDDFGYGGALSIIANIWKENHISFFLYGGKGVANYINDLSGNGYNGVPDTVNNELMLLNTFGGFIAYTQNWSPKLSSNFIFSYLQLEESPLLSNTDFRNSYYILANLFYNPFDRIAIGAEYIYGKLDAQDSQTGDASRVQFLVQFNF